MTPPEDDNMRPQQKTRGGEKALAGTPVYPDFSDPGSLRGRNRNPL